MAKIPEDILTYIKENKTIVLATVDNDNQPDLRTLGGYNFDEAILYFATGKSSNKVGQIANHEKVTILVQSESQELNHFKNVTIYGRAQRLTGSDFEEGRKKILERRQLPIDEESRFIYKVIPEQIKVLDFSKDSKEHISIISI